MSRAIRTQAACALVLSFVVGCAADRVSDVGDDARAAITYSARATYPGNAQRSDQVRIVAMTDTSRRELTIYNLGGRPVPASSVWVNGAFVRQLDSIPPKGNATVNYGQLLEAGAGVKSLAQLDQAPTRVEVQTADGLFTADGPVVK